MTNLFKTLFFLLCSVLFEGIATKVLSADTLPKGSAFFGSLLLFACYFLLRAYEKKNDYAAKLEVLRSQTDEAFVQALSPIVEDAEKLSLVLEILTQKNAAGWEKAKQLEAEHQAELSEFERAAMREIAARESVQAELERAKAELERIESDVPGFLSAQTLQQKADCLRPALISLQAKINGSAPKRLRPST
jgi:hypothetical protein